ncbi:MAG TPA: hypothetical protein V6C96_00060 [Vampirovibrionales bacterium]
MDDLILWPLDSILELIPEDQLRSLVEESTSLSEFTNGFFQFDDGETIDDVWIGEIEFEESPGEKGLRCLIPLTGTLLVRDSIDRDNVEVESEMSARVSARLFMTETGINLELPESLEVKWELPADWDVDEQNE